MNSRLRYINNWAELAGEAGWSAALLARKCGVSLRTLERHFRLEMGKAPKAWLFEQRQTQAVQLLEEGESVKETAGELGYKQSSAFSRAFKKHWGCAPVDRHALWCTHHEGSIGA